MNGNDAAGDASSPPPKTERPRSRIMDRKIRPSGFSAFSPGKQGRRIPSRDRDPPPPPPLPSTTAAPAATPSTPENAKGRGLLNVRDLVRRIEKSGKSSSSSKPDAGASPGDEAAAAAKDDQACQDQGAASATMPPSPARGDGAASARHRRFPLPPTTPTATPILPPQLQQQQRDGPRHGGFRRCYDDTTAAPPVGQASAITAIVEKKPAAAASPPPSPIREQAKQRLPPEYSLALHRGQFSNSRLGDSDDGAKKKAAAPQQQQRDSAGRLKAKKSALDVFGISLGGSSVAAANAAPVKATPASGGDAGMPKEYLETMAYGKGSSEDARRHHSQHEPAAREKYTDISSKGRGSSEVTADSTKAKRSVSGPPSEPRLAKPKPASYSSSVTSPTPAPDDDDGGNGTPRWRSAAESRVFWEGVRAALFVSDDEMGEYSQQQDEARWLRAREAQDRLFWHQQQQQQQQQQMAATPLGNGGFAKDCALCRAAAAAAASDGMGLAAFPTPLQPVTPWDPAAVANRSAMVTPLWRGFRRHRSLASARSSTR
ncbi:hypothetical protein GGTG_06307 [Gaeumannomyces tritici R3-111a-1]|uniref:Uncharacterized protein n=1 Tax=Gaeumannomyces tritici (strain R3-111a-1) TaxID=644352 RepID=J3NYF5_GAET3|nr:hypothetical protein GGTG_06307 [Gaeumannomyces tritici R3-111a-1]EJT76388.1 hypothetical protein GGTG_06307 [Gaeumannomyces tritici R3-111a-1]